MNNEVFHTVSRKFNEKFSSVILNEEKKLRERNGFLTSITSILSLLQKYKYIPHRLTLFYLPQQNVAPNPLKSRKFHKCNPTVFLGCHI